MQSRLQKILAHAGVASRRKAEELILSGRVAVNGHIVAELGAKADPQRDRITLDARPLRPPAQHQYWLFCKPRGVVSTLGDPQHRRHLGEYFPAHRGGRLYPVGRLDYHSEGLMLFTNDGELAERVLKAGDAFPKTYWVKVAGRPTEPQLERLRRGIMLPELKPAGQLEKKQHPTRAQRTAPASIRWLSVPRDGEKQFRGNSGKPQPRRSTDNPWLEVVLTEGRKNQIRRMFVFIGHPVAKLKRVRIGTLSLGKLRPGEMRPLLPPEVERMSRALRPAQSDRQTTPTVKSTRRQDRRRRIRE